jgi:hypothetical protein
MFDWVSRPPVWPISLNKPLWTMRKLCSAQAIVNESKFDLLQAATAKNLAG